MPRFDERDLELCVIFLLHLTTICTHIVVLCFAVLTMQTTVYDCMLPIFTCILFQVHTHACHTCTHLDKLWRSLKQSNRYIGWKSHIGVFKMQGLRIQGVQLHLSLDVFLNEGYEKNEIGKKAVVFTFVNVGFFFGRGEMRYFSVIEMFCMGWPGEGGFFLLGCDFSWRNHRKIRYKNITLCIYIQLLVLKKFSNGTLSKYTPKCTKLHLF